MHIAEDIVRFSPNWRARLLLAVHLLALCGAAMLIFIISYDAICKVSFISDSRYIHVQLWICLLFIADILVEVAMSAKPWHCFVVNMPFLLICVPYINIMQEWNIAVSGPLMFIFRFIPLIRAAVVFAMITGFLTRNRLQCLFRAYIVMLMTLIYFASLMFFVVEHDINAGVSSYGSALWWAIMNMTTTGSNIPEYTPIGRVLANVLSGAGLILIPMLTVYITVITAQKSHSQT